MDEKPLIFVLLALTFFALRCAFSPKVVKASTIEDLTESQKPQSKITLANDQQSFCLPLWVAQCDSKGHRCALCFFFTMKDVARTTYSTLCCLCIKYLSV